MPTSLVPCKKCWVHNKNEGSRVCKRGDIIAPHTMTPALISTEH
jgi:hypothetical protein